MGTKKELSLKARPLTTVKTFFLPDFFLKPKQELDFDIVTCGTETRIVKKYS